MDDSSTLDEHSMVVLAISGSLRAQSRNTDVLRAAAALAPAKVRVVLYSGLAALPHFNPDDDSDDSLPDAVRSLRAEVDRADAILISSPEYAHGVPGSLKNALDWLVGGSEMLYKPIGLLNASPRSTRACASLADTLRTMSAVLVAGASVTLPLAGRQLDADEMVAEPAVADALRGALASLVPAVESYRCMRHALQPSANDALRGAMLLGRTHEWSVTGVPA